MWYGIAGMSTIALAFQQGLLPVSLGIFILVYFGMCGIMGYVMHSASQI